MLKLSEEILEYRIANDITQQELAMLSHLETAQIIDIENGNDDVSISTFESIAHALRIEPKELIGW